MFYEIGYEHLYAKVASGKIEMLNEWNFITPVESEIGLTESGIILDLKKKNILRTGVVRHSCQKLKDMGVAINDTILFKRGREYSINVEEDSYFRIEANDILCKYKNDKEMQALGKILVVREIKESNERDGLITTVAQNPIPEKGEVVSLGDECGDGISVGDTILFRKMASTEVEIEGEKLLLMQINNVYVKV
jgi:co-chaperonin GroES (HSP10)